MLDKPWPAGKAVGPGHEELGIGKRTSCSVFVALLIAPPAPFRALGLVVNSSLDFRSNLERLQACKVRRPTGHPITDCAGFGGIASGLELLGQFLVLFEVGARGKR